MSLLTLREQLASIEHDQWMSWTTWLIRHTKLKRRMPKLVAKWEHNHRPYNMLTEKSKDRDRYFADLVLREVADYMVSVEHGDIDAPDWQNLLKQFNEAHLTKPEQPTEG